MLNTYRPTTDDFRPTKTQTLSCREAGQFDTKFQIIVDGRVTRRAATAWTQVCLSRIPVSRRTRIRQARVTS